MLIAGLRTLAAVCLRGAAASIVLAVLWRGITHAVDLRTAIRDRLPRPGR